MNADQAFLLVCAVLAPTVAATRALSADSSGSPSSFASFLVKYGRTYTGDTTQFDMRRKVFETSIDRIEQQNSQPNRRWTAVVNHLSDRTTDELSQLRGLRSVQSKGGRSRGIVGSHNPGQFLAQTKVAVLPDEKSWRHLPAIMANVDQGACGSCWAVATATMLNAGAQINGHNRSFAAQELVDCVPNPHTCGGEGGCKGATVELGMNWVMDRGLDTELGTPYEGTDLACKKKTTALISTKGDGVGNDVAHLKEMVAVGFHKGLASSPAIALGLQGWERLPENEYEPLMRAVAEKGPAAVSVAASGWNAYGAGVFDSCDKDATIDHAVTLIGYGMDKDRKEKYWTIKNSWGSTWGESGTIRLLREPGNVHCGTDYQPEVGTGCDGGPKQVPVCGMCGILYDAVVPHFVKKAA